ATSRLNMTGRPTSAMHGLSTGRPLLEPLAPRFGRFISLLSGRQPLPAMLGNRVHLVDHPAPLRVVPGSGLEFVAEAVQRLLEPLKEDRGVYHARARVKERPCPPNPPPA